MATFENKCDQCNIYEKQEGKDLCVKCEGWNNQKPLPENIPQVLKGFHLLVRGNLYLTVQHYKPNHPMWTAHTKIFQAILEMESYLKTNYPDEFANSFEDEESYTNGD